MSRGKAKHHKAGAKNSFGFSEVVDSRTALVLSLHGQHASIAAVSHNGWSPIDSSDFFESHCSHSSPCSRDASGHLRLEQEGSAASIWDLESSGRPRLQPCGSLSGSSARGENLRLMLRHKRTAPSIATVSRISEATHLGWRDGCPHIANWVQIENSAPEPLNKGQGVK